ncbi:hypothetical protein GF340_02825 [Candidatus Peregrinibacteria bacterium]|nr:hypothetical protein [Candidatus Peregrinibacteria bacterium]
MLFANMAYAYGERLDPYNYPSRILSRGETVEIIIKSFELNIKERSFLQSCKSEPDYCFFTFSAMSDYDGISFSPMQLYPDVTLNTRYYDSINTATMLGLAHGMQSMEGTPFLPQHVMTRIQALKLIMGASDLMTWKEKFELSEADLPSRQPDNFVYSDVTIYYPENWWYFRYLKRANELDITPENEKFLPNEPVTVSELNDMISNALKVTESNEQIQEV